MGLGKSGSWLGAVRGVARRFLTPLAGSGRGLLGIAILAILLLTGSYYGWSKYGGIIAQNPQYVLTAESFEVTPQPSWIQSDVKSNVMRDGRLTKLSALDPDLIKNAVQAFELNAWVAKVLWAGKRAGPSGPRVIVNIQYRRPVVMVWAEDEKWDGDCFFPVDAEGIVLEPNEFSPIQTLNYLRVDAGDAWPIGTVGTPFGDPGVAGAAALAARIGPQWRAMGLQWVVVRKDMDADVGQPLEATYILLPSGGDPDNIALRRGSHWGNTPADRQKTLEVLWGHAPGRERPDEASAAQKALRLQLFVKQNGPLDNMPVTTVVDLRPAAAISIVDRRRTFQPASLK